MHVPDGFFNATVSVASGLVAAGGIAVCLRRTRDELDERTAPLAGAVAAFVFAVQMINFPVGLGTSGHLLGGALAVVLVGPYAGALCVTVVLIVQSLVFADGGITALGVNIVLMALVTAIVGWAVFRIGMMVLPAARASAAIAAFAAALLSVPCSAAVFALLFALGGNADLPLGGLAAAMVGVHTLIGLGEAVITAAVVSAIAAVRPDLVHGLRDVVAHEARTLAGGVR